MQPLLLRLLSKPHRGCTGDAPQLKFGKANVLAVYTDATTIESRIADLGSIRDVDGDGDITAMADGLLILRYLFGFRGESLVKDAVAAGAQGAAPAGVGQARGQAEPPSATANDLGSIAATLFHWAKEQPDIAVLPAVERELIAHALRETNGNQVRAAKLLGITRATLRKRIEKFGIKQAISVE